MIVELNKRDIIHLLRGTSPSYEAMGLIEEMELGRYTGGCVGRFDWNWQSCKCWDKYSEEDLFKLYKELKTIEL